MWLGRCWITDSRSVGTRFLYLRFGVAEVFLGLCILEVFS
jgi:hypothetical protein